MSTSRHIDIICIAAVLAALLITGLFMHGEALGITALADGDTSDGQFTANDLNGDWDTSGATVITLTGDGGTVRGNGAYVYDGDVHIVYAGKYVLSGALTDGSVIIDADGDDKVWLLLDGVSLHCDHSAALVVEQADKVFLTLGSGTENVISGGTDYSEDAVSAGIDGAIYSRDDLTINGAGSLTVTAEYSHGIVCNDDLVITGGSIDITAAQDGIHAHDSVRLTDMDLTVNAGDDGIHASNDDGTSYIYVESGTISIPSCYEGIEAIYVTIAGGTIDIRPTDDGLNANGAGESVISITGGDITILNETGRDADGLDSNGSIYISGGRTFISVNSSSCALDYGTENGGECLISGGTVIAAGGRAMAEGFDSASEQCFIMYTTSNAAAGTQVSLTNSAGTVLVDESIPYSFSSIVISTPDLQMGETCTISIGGAEAAVTVDNSSNPVGFGMGGGMQGGRGDMVGRGGMDFGAGGDMTGQMPSGEMPAMPGGGGFPGKAGGEAPAIPDGEAPAMPSGGMPNMAEDGSPPDMSGDQTAGFREGGPMDSDLAPQQEQDTSWTDSLPLLGASVLVLAMGLLFALKFKR